MFFLYVLYVNILTLYLVEILMEIEIMLIIYKYPISFEH